MELNIRITKEDGFVIKDVIVRGLFFKVDSKEKALAEYEATVHEGLRTTSVEAVPATLINVYDDEEVLTYTILVDEGGEPIYTAKNKLLYDHHISADTVDGLLDLIYDCEV